MKYEAIKIVSIFVPHPLCQWSFTLIWWKNKMQIHMYVAWYRKTNANVIKLYKMKEISIFHQYFGTIDSFIYKAYYIDF